MSLLNLIPGAAPVSAVLSLARRWWKAAAGAVLGAMLCFPLAHCDGVHDERAAAKARARAAADVQAARAAAASEAAAVRRARDAADLQAKFKERSDAIHAGADEAPSGPECRLNRQRMLQHGANPAKLPACR